MSDPAPVLEPRDQVRVLVLETLQSLKGAFGELAECRDAEADALLADAEHRLAQARRASARLLKR